MGNEEVKKEEGSTEVPVNEEVKKEEDQPEAVEVEEEVVD